MYRPTLFVIANHGNVAACHLPPATRFPLLVTRH